VLGRRLCADAYQLDRLGGVLCPHSGGRVGPRRLASVTSLFEEATSETSFPTSQSPTRQAARLSPPHGHQGRKGGPQGAPAEGPPPPGSLKWDNPRRSTFERLRNARAVQSGPVLVSWVPGDPPGPAVLVFVISKRVGKAVVRNRLRRRVREAARRLKLPAGFYLFRCRPGAGALGFAELSGHVAHALVLATAKEQAHSRPGTGRDGLPAARHRSPS